MHSVKDKMYSTPKVLNDKIILRSDAFLKFLFKIRFKRGTKLNAGVLCQSASRNTSVIMPSWLPKVPSRLRKDALCLSKSALNNFALYGTNN